jgi:hypothetical protein
MIRERYREEFEQLGVVDLTKCLNGGMYGEDKRKAARVWLDAQEHGEDLAYRAEHVRLQSETAKGHHSNDDKSPLISLMNCIICRQTMKIEKSSPDAEGKDIIQYRCGRCDRIERVRLLRRSRDVLI